MKSAYRFGFKVKILRRVACKWAIDYSIAHGIYQLKKGNKIVLLIDHLVNFLMQVFFLQHIYF